MLVQIWYLTILDSSNSLHVDSNNFDFLQQIQHFWFIMFRYVWARYFVLFYDFLFRKNIHHVLCKPSFGVHELSSSLAMKTNKIY